MAISSPGHFEYQLLVAHARKGIRYSTFEDFWQHCLERQVYFFPYSQMTGPLKAVHDRIRDNAAASYQQFTKDHPADGCGGSPQAGGASLSLSRPYVGELDA